MKWIIRFLRWAIPFRNRSTLAGIDLHPIEEAILEHFPKDMRPFELAYMRTAQNMNWDKSTKIRNRKLFVAGWNAAVFVKAKMFVANEMDLQKMEHENRKLDAKLGKKKK